MVKKGVGAQEPVFAHKGLSQASKQELYVDDFITLTTTTSVYDTKENCSVREGCRLVKLLLVKLITVELLSE